MIPPSLRSHVLDELHQGHIGVAKIKSLGEVMYGGQGLIEV